MRIVSDPSVSRLHAILTQDEDGRLSAQDCASKFGTFVNGRKLGRGEAVRLSCGDAIKFGGLASEYAVLEERQVHSRIDLARAILDGAHVPGQPGSTKRFDRRALFAGLFFKQDHLGLVSACGGTIDEDEGDDWAMSDILDAIIDGRLKKRPLALSMSVVHEFSVPLPARKPAVCASPNFKRFRKAQPASLPDIISAIDMVVHSNGSSGHRHEDWLDRAAQQQPVPVKPADECLAGPLKSPRASAAAREEFQSDFFKSLV